MNIFRQTIIFTLLSIKDKSADLYKSSLMIHQVLIGNVGFVVSVLVPNAKLCLFSLNLWIQFNFSVWKHFQKLYVNHITLILFFYQFKKAKLWSSGSSVWS